MLLGMAMSSLTLPSLCAAPAAGSPSGKGERDAHPASPSATSCSLAGHLQEMTLQEGTSACLEEAQSQPAAAGAGAGSVEAAGGGTAPPAAAAASVKQEPGQGVAGPSSRASAGGRCRGSSTALTPRVKAEPVDSIAAAEEGFGQVQLQASPELAQESPEEEMPTQGYQSEVPSGEPWGDENSAAAGNATHISGHHSRLDKAGRSGAARRSGRLSASTQVHGPVKTEPAPVTSGLKPS